MLSIVIPALNEEKYIRRLLESVKKQGISDYEVIVADAGSSDKTVKIAKSYKCKIVKGGLPACGRNNGAAAARGDLILFLDADCFLPGNCLKKSLAEYRKRKLNAATFTLLPDEKKGLNQLLLNLFYNWPMIMLEQILPHGAMGIFMDKKLFFKLNGFDETVKLAEDHDLVRRAKRIARFGVIRASSIFVSDRRFEKDGWAKTGFKFLFCELHMIFLGPVRTDIFRYRFNHYSKRR